MFAQTFRGTALRNIHHVGIVQPDFDAVEDYMALFGHTEAYRGYVEAFRCWCLFCASAPGTTAVELVVPDGGPLAKFNSGFGGLHHYAYETSDLERERTSLAAEGITMLNRDHVKGAGDFLCNFVNPIFTKGILVEYVQPVAHGA
jgi:catechol 2,3-dioxygenase-like lactoylglutathione lyase family enzyme